MINSLWCKFKSTSEEYESSNNQTHYQRHINYIIKYISRILFNANIFVSVITKKFLQIILYVWSYTCSEPHRWLSSRIYFIKVLCRQWYARVSILFCDISSVLSWCYKTCNIFCSCERIKLDAKIGKIKVKLYSVDSTCIYGILQEPLRQHNNNEILTWLNSIDCLSYIQNS